MTTTTTTSSAPYWPSTTKYYPAPSSTFSVLSCINQFCFILTQYYHTSTPTVLYWPSTTKYQPVLPSVKIKNVRLGILIRSNRPGQIGLKSIAMLPPPPLERIKSILRFHALEIDTFWAFVFSLKIFVHDGNFNAQWWLCKPRYEIWAIPEVKGVTSSSPKHEFSRPQVYQEIF